MNRYYALVIVCFFSSCVSSEYGLHVQRQKVGLQYLASERIHTRDQKRLVPPVGENLLVSWDFSDQEFLLHPKLVLVVRFYDQREETKIYTPKKKSGGATFFFPGSSSDNSILCYKIILVDEWGVPLKEIKNRLWVEKIS